MWQPEPMQSWPALRPWWPTALVTMLTPNHWYAGGPPSWQVMQVSAPTAVWAVVLPCMFMPANDVNTAAEWHFSHVMPTVGMCVDGEGAVGEPPARSGVVFG